MIDELTFASHCKANDPVTRDLLRRAAEALTTKDAELAEWKQAAEVEAGVRREALELVNGLRAALEPFKRAAGFHEIQVQTDDSLHVLVKVAPGLSGALTVKDFRRARQALDDRKKAAPWPTSSQSEPTGW